ncbi:dihydroorotase [Salibacterium salarium]|uniref:dihydroorotase n=1 Tax=Salibacterium salarium TaxID=284579 RepID=UPI00278B218D|nr:dihydroorotase [Salibacterium salarium]
MNGWIINGYVFTEGNNVRKMDIEIKGDSIHSLGKAPENATILYDVRGKLVTPGFVDVHVHLREPGGEHKETIETGTAAAAKGGFTTICPMPNTNPVPDCPEVMEQLQTRIQKSSLIHVLPYASITEEQLGQELSNFKDLKKAGAFAFTDDGVGVQDASLMLKAMKQAAKIDMPIVAHCEENTLIQGGSVHEGEFSEKHNMNGIPSVCESVQIARDVLLAEAANAHYHVCHVSTKESVRVIRNAKEAGIHVTAEVTPHHLLLNENDIPDVDPQFKMNPPLRAKADQQALLDGWLDGTIDCIATDHAPHAEAEKAKSMEDAPFGITGLETAFPLLYKHLVETGVCSLGYLLESITKKPANVFGLEAGQLSYGNKADITIVDLDMEEKVDAASLVSKGKNTPFDGWSSKGQPVLTIVNGNVVYEKEGVRLG